MNCSEVDLAYDEARRLLAHSDEGFALACSALLLVSLALLVRGEDWVRPLGAIAGSLAGAVFGYVSSEAFDAACEIRLAATAIGCVTGCVLALCAFRIGVAAVGAGAFGTLAHLVYEAFVVGGGGGSKASWIYYVSVGGSGVVGSAVAYAHRKHVLRLSSAILGATGSVASLHLLLERFAQTQLSALVQLSLVSFLTGIGVVAQRLWASRRRRRNPQTPSAVPPLPPSSSSSSSVPMGLRV